MSTSHSIAKLILPPESDRSLDEAEQRGYLSHVIVEIDGLRQYPVFFYTPERLQFELESRSKDGQPFIAEVGMIVLAKLTFEAMQSAVQRLCDEGYFDYLVPLTPQQISNAGSYGWPP